MASILTGASASKARDIVNGLEKLLHSDEKRGLLTLDEGKAIADLIASMRRQLERLDRKKQG